MPLTDCQQSFNSFCVLALLFALAGGLLAQSLPEGKVADVASKDQARLTRLATQFEELRTLLKIPGLSAAVVRDQKVLWAKGFGFANPDQRSPATPDTPYVIASLTKT